MDKVLIHAKETLNPPIPTAPCFKCGVFTNETQSIYGIGHYKCFMSTAAVKQG